MTAPSDLPSQFTRLQPVLIKAILKRVRSYKVLNVNNVTQRFEWQRVELDEPLMGVIKDKRNRSNGDYEPYRSWCTNTSNGCDYDDSPACYFPDHRFQAYTVRLLGRRKDVVVLPDDLQAVEP